MLKDITFYSDTNSADRRAIRDLLENWVLWRDAGFWEKFRTVWHDDGRMTATWCLGAGEPSRPC